MTDPLANTIFTITELCRYLAEGGLGVLNFVRVSTGTYRDVMGQCTSADVPFTIIEASYFNSMAYRTSVEIHVYSSLTVKCMGRMYYLDTNDSCDALEELLIKYEDFHGTELSSIVYEVIEQRRASNTLFIHVVSQV